jgi:Protein of unknown function (DUF2950)
MTFTVSEDGVVYEKDLGANTSTIASSLKARKLDSSWRAAEGAHESHSTSALVVLLLLSPVPVPNSSHRDGYSGQIRGTVFVNRH